MDVKTALKELADMIKAEIMNRVREEGVNPKTGTNTLISSDLIKNMRVEAVSDNEIVFQIADYYQSVVTGRWRRTGSLSSFLNAIIRWMTKKNVHSYEISDNQLAWAIAKSIMNDGIMARPFIKYDPNDDPSVVLPFLDDYFNKWADDIFEKITEQLDKYFN